MVEFIDDGDGLFRVQIGGDEVRLEFVPIDFRLVGDRVEEFLEEACHVGGKVALAGKL